MTPKDKAKELISKFTFLKLPEDDSKFYNPKQCALIAVREIIPIVESYEDALSASQKSDELSYWGEVKQEIEKL